MFEEEDPYDDRSSTHNTRSSTLRTRAHFNSASNHRNRENKRPECVDSTDKDKPPKNAKVAHISLKKCNELISLESDQILLKITSPHFGLENYLETDRMGSDLLNIFTELLVKAFKCNAMRQKITEIISLLPQSNYYKNLLYNSIENRLKNDEYNIELIKNTLNLSITILQVNPGNKRLVEPMKDKLEVLSKLRTRNQELIDKFTKFEELIDKKEELVQQTKTFSNKINQSVEPPSKFTDLTIIPSLKDIIADEEPFLRENITNGAYRSVDHYLDVQFRLLREDFLQPLRIGVRKLRAIIDAEKRIKQKKFELNKQLADRLKKEVDSVNIYFEIKMRSNIATNNGIVYSMHLNNSNNMNKKINWERSKRLMFGSLVCLSKDYFQTHCLVATVCERDLKKLENEGDIYLQFDYSLNFNNLPKVNEEYIMIEASAYFESYKHVLEAFVSFQQKPDEFPFKENLVFCQNDKMPMPAYLENAYVDFRCLIEEEKGIQIDPRTGLNNCDYNYSSEYAKNVFVADENQWPSPNQLKFDLSQYSALKLALNNKLALIQGPPGTGKTFIGVKIVELLLNNRHLWWNRFNERPKPILMICYTNHALDQFLELIIDKCKLNSGVVRVGGRSKSEKLNPFLLRNIKRIKRTERTIDAEIHYRVRDALDQLSAVKNEIEIKIKAVEESYLGLINMKYLSQFIEPNLLEQFYDHCYQYNQITNDPTLLLNLSLLNWLGFFEREQLDVNNNEFKEMRLSDNEPLQDESDDEYEEEDDFNDRMLDDDIEIFSKIKRKDMKIDKDSRSYIEKLKDCDHIIKESLLNQIQEANNDGWQTSGQKKNESRILKLILNISNNSNKDLNVKVSNIWGLQIEYRYKLYNKWLIDYKISNQEEIDKLQDKYNKAAINLNEIRMQEDRSIMQNALIIAMTTTGSARYHRILKDIGPRIVMVEEAAEVFEAHIISSLSKNCEHLILIGDHYQLRPNPTVYKLAKEYHIDVSLFERLINNNIKKEMLTCQHRMRPEISVLMRHFYNNQIRDHRSVESFLSIRGLNTNIFFIDHKNIEKKDPNSDDTSKLNQFEADYLAAFCNYLIKQHYSESQITILSMYLGQLAEIRSIIKKKYKLNAVKVSTVDNYQGEENDIILLSLVRSNYEKRIGFLSIKNRVCVALSRAKHGLYVIGNFSFLSEQNQTWNEIYKAMKAFNTIGNHLTLSCGKHSQNDLKVVKASDFETRPEGGCKLPCEYRLKCGHNCRLLCHTYSHDQYVCASICNRVIYNCGHNCLRTCGHDKTCDFECKKLVEKLVPECGHKTLIKCYLKPDRKQCMQQCNKPLSCGHSCENRCFEIPCKPCTKMIEIDSVCNHKGKIMVKCSDENFKHQLVCNKKCTETLSCGHKCKGICGKDCHSGLLHKRCQECCDKQLLCGHKCSEKCSEQCTPCQKECKNRCFHSQCNKKCGLLCIKCMEKCPIKCQHKQCSRPCNELCNIDPCDQPCLLKLQCKHQCMGLCGEKCPSLCSVCDKKIPQDIKVITIVDCGHTFDKNILDDWVQSSFEKNNQQLPECPKCQTKIQLTQRYIRYTKTCLLNIEDLKIKNIGNQFQLRIVKQRTLSLINQLENYNVSIKQLKTKIDSTELTINDYQMINKKLDLFNNLTNLLKIASSEFKSDNWYFKLIEFECNKLKSFLFSNNEIKTTLQQFNDAFNEYKRLEKVIKYAKYQSLIQNKLISSNMAPIKSIQIARQFAKLEELLIHKVNPYYKVEDLVINSFEEIHSLTNGL